MTNKLNRRLAAIMFTDIQGYTALMQEDEAKGIIMRQRHRQVFNATTEKYGGEIIQYYGDGTLSIFDSVVNAVKCGIAMQLEFKQDVIVPLRIGIHQGDIVLSDEEIIGDAVNVSARIESLAIAGSILVSDLVQKELFNQKDIETQSLGLYEMKNVTEPMEIFAISNKGLAIPSPDQLSEKVKRLQPHKEEVSKKKKSSKKSKDQDRKITISSPGGGATNQVTVKKSKKKWWNYITSSAVIIGIVGSLVGTANIININFFKKVEDSTELTVYVHGPDGQQDMVIENEGEIVIDFDGDRRTAQIGENGRTVFTEIPDKFKGKPIPIQVITDGWETENPDQLYEWTSEAIYIPLKIESELLEIQGIVKNADGSSLIEGAKIIIQDKFFTTTDSNGMFIYKMKSKGILNRYNLTIQKDGFQPLSEYYYPGTSAEFRLTKK
jgi:class 3 adenylate cyclase